MAQTTDHNAGNTPSEPNLPPIAAAFLVSFDNRKGYTLSWQKAINGVQLEGVVEFKSLPSGLHNVDEDLVYFVHEDYVGISAFLKRGDDAAARNARMLSVGVLVRVESGRMGRSWLYAGDLKSLTRTLSDDMDNHAPLEEFWEKHQDTGHPTHSPSTSSVISDGYQKPRALSTGSLSTPNRSLPAHHPALALLEMLAVFGPLIFPLFRAALLRKRILILGEAPVEAICNFVHDISILSSISVLVGAHLPSYDPSQSRLKPLFNVGISDISMLESLTTPWIACTTDDVLSSKPNLFDMLVILPNSTALQKTSNRRYAKLIASSEELTKTFPRKGLLASQRDARRYSALKRSLHMLPSGASTIPSIGNGDDDDAKSTTSSVSTIFDKREAVEALPWTVVAYNSLIWWASAGDRRTGLLEADEAADEQDEELIRDCVTEEETTQEVAMVAYFHKLTTLIFTVLNSAVKRQGPGIYRDEEEEEEENADDRNGEDQTLLSSKTDEEDVVEISEEDVRAMGLDVWNEPDKHFITEILHVWWKRKAQVHGGAIECCGIRLL